MLTISKWITGFAIAPPWSSSAPNYRNGAAPSNRVASARRARAQLPLDLLEPGDALLHGRVRREEPHDAGRGVSPAEGIDDEHVRLGRAHAGRHRDLLRGGVQLAQGARECVRIRREQRPRLVGLELPGPRDRHLNDRGRERREDPRQEQPDGAERAVVVVIAAAEEQDEARQERDAHPDGRRDGGDQDVAVGDMRELVRQHGSELALVQDLQDPARHGDGRVLGVPARGEGVGLAHLGHVQPGHGHPGLPGELPDDPVVRGELPLGHGMRAGRCDGDLVGEPVHREVEDDDDCT